MKGRVGMNTLAALVVLVLGTSVCDGLLIDKCKLRDQLNSTLPASVLNQTNTVAKIVCYVEMRSGFNTSAINQTVGPEIRFPPPGRHDGRHRRSAPHSGGRESSEETFGNPKNESDPKPSNPGAGQRGNGSSSKGDHHPRRARSHGSSGEHHDEIRSNHTEAPHHNSSMPGNGSHSGHDAHQNGTGGGHGLQKPPKEASGHGGRRGRSAPSSHSQHGGSHGPNNQQGGNGGKAGRGTPGSGMDDSSEETSERSRENAIWTLYGLFQLPDRLACTSGATPSLNLCNVTCDSFLNDDISDDITCMGILLNKALSAGKSHVPVEGPVKNYFDGAFQACKNVVDLQYFSTC